MLYSFFSFSQIYVFLILRISFHLCLYFSPSVWNVAQFDQPLDFNSLSSYSFNFFSLQLSDSANIFFQLSSDLTQSWIFCTPKTSSQSKVNLTGICKTKGLCSPGWPLIFPAIWKALQNIIHFTFLARKDEGVHKENLLPQIENILKAHKWVISKWPISYQTYFHSDSHSTQTLLTGGMVFLLSCWTDLLQPHSLRCS